MTQAEEQRIKAIILANAAYYNHKMEDLQLVMFAKDLTDLNFEEVSRAYDFWRMNPKNKTYPLPAQIRAQIEVPVTDEDSAREAAARITGALSKFGYVNGWDAKRYIGPLGWAIVEMQGGWAALCERVQKDELPTYQAQWRELGLTLCHKFRSGHDLAPPSLPAPTGRTFIREFRKQNSLDAAINPKRETNDGPEAS